MRAVTTAERRARLTTRHQLDTPAPDPVAAAAAIVGFHSSDPASVYLSARARVAGFTVAALEKALYDDRTLLRVLGMRRTMFVVPPDLAAVVDAGCARALAPPERRRLAGWVADQGLAPGDPHRWLDELADAVLASLAARGEATAAELTEDVPGLAKRISFGGDRKWAGTVGMATRMVFLLAAEGKIIRARPLGSWRSAQYRWTGRDGWLLDPLPDWDEGEARIDLVRRYLAAYGPATFTDVKWWTGWGVGVTRAVLAGAGAVEVELDEGAGYLHPDDVDPVPSAAPQAALLPGLDPAVMGWKEREWTVGPHAGALFDRNGNAGPTVWWDGRVVGGWAQRPAGEVVYRLPEDVGAEGRAAIEREAGELEAWLAGTVVMPRFPAPLDKELRVS